MEVGFFLEKNPVSAHQIQPWCWESKPCDSDIVQDKGKYTNPLGNEQQIMQAYGLLVSIWWCQRYPSRIMMTIE